MPIMNRKLVMFLQGRRGPKGLLKSASNILAEDSYLFSLRIGRRVIETEDIPLWAYYQNACLGETEWRSTCIEKWRQLGAIELVR